MLFSGEQVAANPLIVPRAADKVSPGLEVWQQRLPHHQKV